MIGVFVLKELKMKLINYMHAMYCEWPCYWISCKSMLKDSFIMGKVNAHRDFSTTVTRKISFFHLASKSNSNFNWNWKKWWLCRTQRCFAACTLLPCKKHIGIMHACWKEGISGRKYTATYAEGGKVNETSWSAFP